MTTLGQLRSRLFRCRLDGRDCDRNDLLLLLLRTRQEDSRRGCGRVVLPHRPGLGFGQVGQADPLAGVPDAVEHPPGEGSVRAARVLAQAEEAQAAADRESKARGRPVEVAQRADSSWEEGKKIQAFSGANESALLGYAAQSEAKARRLRTEVEKLEAFCSVVQAAAAAKDQPAFVEVSRAAASALRVKFGGGSVSSCSAWLAGSKGRATLDSLLAGEVELTVDLLLEQVVQTVELARKAEKLAT